MTNSKSGHTKGKWKVQKNYPLDAYVSIRNETGEKLIARTMFGKCDKEEAEANAERIVKAVNNFDMAIEFLKISLSHMKIFDGQGKENQELMAGIEQLIKQAEQK